MKTKRLLFIGALIALPSFGKPAKKSAGMSQFKAKRVAPQTTQVMRNDRHNQNISSRMGSTRYYGGTRYNGTRSYAGRQYAGTRYYGGTRYYNGGGSYPLLRLLLGTRQSRPFFSCRKKNIATLGDPRCLIE